MAGSAQDEAARRDRQTRLAAEFHREFLYRTFDIEEHLQSICTSGLGVHAEAFAAFGEAFFDNLTLGRRLELFRKLLPALGWEDDCEQLLKDLRVVVEIRNLVAHRRERSVGDDPGSAQFLNVGRHEVVEVDREAALSLADACNEALAELVYEADLIWRERTGDRLPWDSPLPPCGSGHRDAAEPEPVIDEEGKHRPTNTEPGQCLWCDRELLPGQGVVVPVFEGVTKKKAHDSLACARPPF